MEALQNPDLGPILERLRNGDESAWIWSRPEPPRFSRPYQLPAAEGVEDLAAWSPAGDAILYQATPGGEVFGGSPDVWTVDLEDGTLRQLTRSPAMDAWPQWSPDGSALYLVGPTSSGCTIWPRVGSSR